MKWYEQIKRVQLFLLLLVTLPVPLIQMNGLLDLSSQVGLADPTRACRGCLGNVALLPNGDGWASENREFAEGYASHILHRQHGIWRWEAIPLGALEYITSISADAPDDAWAVTDGYFNTTPGSYSATGLLHYTHASWHRVPFTLPQALRSFVMLTPNDGWAIEDGGLAQQPNTNLLHFDGQSWQPPVVPGVDNFISLAFTSPQDGWAVGRKGHIAHYGAGQWREVAAPTTDDLYFVQMLSPTSAWAVGKAGTMLYYDGTTWAEHGHASVNTPDFLLHPIAMISDHEGWATGNNQYVTTMKLWHFDGATWNTVALPANTNLFAIASQGTDVVAVGEDARTREPFSPVISAQGAIAYAKDGAVQITATPRLGEPLVFAVARGILAGTICAIASFALLLLVVSYRQPRTSLLRHRWARFTCAWAAVAALLALIDIAEPLVATTYHDLLRQTVPLLSGVASLTAAGGLVAMILWEQRENNKPTPADLVIQPVRDHAQPPG